MTIKALPEPCFIDGGQRDGFHSADGESFDAPSALPAPCFIAVCDGIPGHQCGETFSDGEYDESHYESAEQVITALRSEGWEWLAILAAVRCQQCADELAATVLPAEGAAS